MEISSGPSIQVQTEVLKKATETQEQAVSSILQDSAQQLQEQQQIQQTQQKSTAQLTGLGGSLDLRT